MAGQDRPRASASAPPVATASRRYPRRAASSATTSAMCSQGSGDRGATSGSAWWMVLSGQIKNAAPARASLPADASISSPTPCQSSRSRQAT